jgi:hypothetical protein
MHDPDEWCQRYAARLVERGGCLSTDAERCARTALEEGCADMGPVAAADDEMSYWSDDGES